MASNIQKRLEFKNKDIQEDFDIFNLNRDIDKHPRSWICIKGEGIKDIISEIEAKMIKEKGFSRESLAKLLSKRLNCNLNSFKRLFRREKEFYPIPFIKELVGISGDKEYFNKIHFKIEHLKVNSAISKEVRSIKKLIPDLCKILGAFMADGSLTMTISFASKNKFDLKLPKKVLKKFNMHYNEWYCKSRKEYSLSLTINQQNYNLINKIIISLNNKGIQIQSHYNIEITDEHKSNIKSFKKWMINSFKVLPNSFKEKGGGWRLTYSNKIIARYFMTFFDVIPGSKTYTAFEPSIIKNSCFEMRKLFARGVLMFDGSYTSAGKLTFSSKSRYLFESLKEIFRKDDIAIGTTRNRGDYIIFTYENNPKEKFLSFFEKETIKWKRVRDSYIKEHRDLEELENRYKIYPNNKVTFKNLYDYINEVGVCDWNHLAKKFKCSRHQLKQYLIILENSKLIKFSKNPVFLKDIFIDDSIKILLKERFHNYLFKRIERLYKNYKILGDVIKIKKGTLSAWKVRKSKIPLVTLKEICRYCNINTSLIRNNIQQTDRRIIEII